MPTENIHERSTKYSKVVRVTVVDDNGDLRVFHMTNAKVIFKGRMNGEWVTYNPKNLHTSGKFSPYPEEQLEIALVTSDPIELECLDEDRS